jgi:DNA-binding NarL/FixJ family response regulator
LRDTLFGLPPDGRFHYVRLVDTPNDTLRVVLADGHHFFREGLRGTLETAGIAVVGEAKDGTEAVTLAGDLQPDVVVIDLDMPGALGADALRQIASVSPEARVVVLTVSADQTDVLDALEAGACGYILKDTSAEEVVGCIRQAVGGQAVLTHEVMRALVARAVVDNHRAERSGPAAKAPELTTRELQVLRLLAGGADNAAIGLELSISRHTVKQHVTNIFEKLGVRTRVEAAVYAVRTGLV